MAPSVRLRPWQHAALERFAASTEPDFLAVATPGAGKTTFALTALRVALADRPSPVIVVAPTAHLKTQWARAATRFQLHLDPAWSPTHGRLPADMHGIVTTYQQVATSSEPLARLAAGAFVVLDEVHHAGEDRAWGQSLTHAFSPAARRLSLSGTPFRSDTRAIPFVRYHLDEAVPDYEYGYGDALSDRRVVRPVYFPRTGGHMEWSAPDGSLYSATFEDPLAQALANQRLRTALSITGEWLPAVLRTAVDRLADVRRTHPAAGGLVIATDQAHARDIAHVLRTRFRGAAVVVTSDDPTASARIAAFAEGTTEWLVAVRMVSEGVDIPRLRVGVFATTTTTDLFFRQAVGRLVRWTPGVRDQRAWLFIPDDPRLRARAAQIAEQRRHSLLKAVAVDAAEPDPAALDEVPPDPDEQLSLFSALSAVATGDPEAWDPWDEPLPDDWAEDGADAPGEDADIELVLAPPPPVAGGVGSFGAGLTRREQKELLRAANAEVAKELARYTGWEHARVNGELNRLAGLRRVTEATTEQLERRLREAERWLGRLGVRAAAAPPWPPTANSRGRG
jgi:superfamily II DNA or RNA helicase